MLNDFLADPAKQIFAVLSLLMVLELIVAFVFFNIAQQFVRNARTVRAKITGLEPLQKGMKAAISLKDPMNKEIETTIIVPTTKYKVNDEIELLSHKENPAKVKFNSFLSLWLMPVAMLQGVVVLGIALGVLTSMGVARFPF